MEVKINREIRNYTESMFFGLSLRQLLFSLIACAVAAGIYFLFKDSLGTETVSWLCILAAAPFAAFGFIKYHGMNTEELIMAWLKSEYLIPKKMTLQNTVSVSKPTIVKPSEPVKVEQSVIEVEVKEETTLDKNTQKFIPRR